MQTVAQSASPRTEVNYLNNERSLKSWLTTVDHKRIAIMFASTLALAFLAGGVLALLIRTELLTPTQLILCPDTYNRMFTMHGVLMVVPFLVPSVPGILGNFFLRVRIAAKGLAS